MELVLHTFSNSSRQWFSWKCTIYGIYNCVKYAESYISFFFKCYLYICLYIYIIPCFIEYSKKCIRLHTFCCITNTYIHIYKYTASFIFCLWQRSQTNRTTKQRWYPCINKFLGSRTGKHEFILIINNSEKTTITPARFKKNKCV